MQHVVSRHSLTRRGARRSTGIPITIMTMTMGRALAEMKLIRKLPPSLSLTTCSSENFSIHQYLVKENRDSPATRILSCSCSKMTNLSIKFCCVSLEQLAMEAPFSPELSKTKAAESEEKLKICWPILIYMVVVIPLVLVLVGFAMVSVSSSSCLLCSEDVRGTKTYDDHLSLDCKGTGYVLPYGFFVQKSMADLHIFRVLGRLIKRVGCDRSSCSLLLRRVS